MKRLIAVTLFALLTGCGFEIVDTGHRGVRTTFGDVDPIALPEGFHWYNPFTSNIKEMNVQTLRVETNTETYTKDVQQATIKYVLNYSLEPAAAPEIFKTVGIGWADVLIPQVVLDAIKEVIGKWDAVDLIEHRNKAVAEIGKMASERLAIKHVLVSNFAVTDISYTKAFEHSVEAKMVAIQKAIEEKNRTVQIDEQAKQTVLRAEAEAKSMQIRARALEQNPKLTEWEAVQKWNGVMPQYMLGGAMPLINIK